MSDSVKKYYEDLEKKKDAACLKTLSEIRNMQVHGEEEIREFERMDYIGQNGNDGEHYEKEKPVDHFKEDTPYIAREKEKKLKVLEFDLSKFPIKEKGNTEDKGTGLRYNTGKLRYDLLHPVAQKGIVSVLTAGANKYAPRNWENGMNWSTVLASMKRHIAAIEQGEDFDPETGLLHIDHVQCNAHFLSAYYKIFPQGDDRRHNYLEVPKIGLDIDEVLADFVGGLMKRFPHFDKRAVYWNDYKISDTFSEVIDDEEFWLSLDAKTDSLPFEPHCYITSRPIDTKITEKWLASKGFPKAPVYTVGLDKSKVEVAKESGINVFVDDAYHNFVELNKEGILCYLFNAPHNERYDVGFKRIEDLKDLL